MSTEPHESGDTDKNHESIGDEFESRVRDMVTGDYDDDTNFIGFPEVTLKSWNFSATYVIYHYDDVIEQALRDMDTTPEWDDAEQKYHWKANIAKRLIADRLDDAGIIDATRLRQDGHMATELKKGDMHVTVMY